MLRDELLRHLVMLPADAEVVIDVGRIQVEVVDIAGIQYRGEREVIALKPHPDDLGGALAARDAPPKPPAQVRAGRERPAATT